jgi:two-component system, LuxR family, response regulator DctR
VTPQRTVHIVDDDPAIRDALSWLFDSRGLATASYASAEDFLRDFRVDVSDGVACLLLDLRMEAGMSGLELQDRLVALGIHVPVIFLTGHGDVPVAVRALRHGAVDFIEKPFNDNELVDRVIACLNEEAQRIVLHSQQASAAQRLGRLTPRDTDVLERMLAGKYNKVIAEELGVSERTVEVHRSSILRKMGARNAVELAHMLATLKSRPQA